MNGVIHIESDCPDFVEVDPTGRYGRYNEILGKGASKTVYRAFDEYEGIEVAWNQVKLYDFLQSPEDLERLYCEIHLLKTLKHQNIMKFYTSWVDVANRNINFVTEMFTSGTLRQFRLKHKRVNIRAVKHWCRQILNGLLYLHSHDPPVIHRDLKCDNIFVNGNQGEVKIGDLGLAAILRKSHAAHCVGTPEFMAPEVYLEEYNELVDIYSFGMCVLEMVTLEYPYSECTHPAQIYKKVISGKKPDGLYKVKDPEVRQFIEKCLATVSLRLSARELLNDPFLRIDDGEADLKMIECQRDVHYMDRLMRQPFVELDYEGTIELDYEGKSCDGSYNGYSNGYAFEDQNGWACHPSDFEQSGIELFEINEDEHSSNLDITIKGKRREEDDSIFLRLRISDKEGRIRNIYFPFDIELDTALSVATEMVAELDMTDQDVTKIADMIDGEIALLVPEWKPGPGIEETPRFANSSFCPNCSSNRTSTGSFLKFLPDNGGGSVQFSQCLGNGCAASHGRFEEITYQVVSSPKHVSGCADNLVSSSLGNGFHHREIWDQHESLECSSLESAESHSLGECEKLDKEISPKEKKGSVIEDYSLRIRKHMKSLSGSRFTDFSTDYEHIQQELRWHRAMSQMKLRELREQQIGFVRRSSKPPLSTAANNKMKNGRSSFETLLKSSNDCHDTNSSDLEGDVQKSRLCFISRRNGKSKGKKESPSHDDLVTEKSFYRVKYPSKTHHRTTSLPIDAVDL